MGANAADNSQNEVEDGAVSQAIPIVVLSVLVAAVVIALIILCVMKKKKKDEKEAKLEDGEVQEDLITANSQHQVHSAPDMDSQLKQGIRETPTNGITPTFEFPSPGNPEHKKWYESKAIPFMDSSVGSIPEATAAERA